MCGIIGYVGARDAVQVLLNGLRRLEYRGYDSAGICISSAEKLHIARSVGKVSALESGPVLKKLYGTVGIAHTRWATHGEPTQENAHPHADCKGEFAIVHNGIIENYAELKQMLIEKGHVFRSETDSEVVAHLIEEFYDGSFEKAVRNAVSLVAGAFGIVAAHRGENKLIAVRKSSPIVIGIGNNEMFVASDPAAIVEYTRKVVYLGDGELAVITPLGYTVKKMSGEKVNKHVDNISFSLSHIEKKGFKHFMLKEIFEQPESVGNVMRGRLKGSEIKLSINVDTRAVRRVILVACGTSWHAALIGKQYIEKYAKIPCEADYASEFRYRDLPLSKDDLVVAISQSGETADTLGAALKAKSHGAKTIGIINVVGSAISREVDGGIYLHAGPEVGVASTKAFTSQVVALFLLALYIRLQNGGLVPEDAISELKQLPAKIDSILDNAGQIQRIASEIKSASSILYLGRGINYPVALEGALKLKEVSYIHAEGYPAGEMKHGPIALVEEGFPVVFIATKDSNYEKVLANISEIRARKGRVIVVADVPGVALEGMADFIIEVPRTIPDLSPILNVIPLQMLAYYTADLKGLDVDKPRNLAKSVTVE
ncbi:MAG: glutamine--fructose-6-phosphate transaminase (isomerizing) [Candidatus Micrarchaeota archaeon]|nr:glutamine--fructose-6-phosphate transaminase (isomerizing) [Candidatus Micrarchaeota archaeon]